MRSKLLFALLFLISITYSLQGTYTNADRVGYLYIGDHKKSISQGTWIYVKNALDYYKKEKVGFIILELDTPGGEVYAAQKISDALKESDIQFDIPVVAFINNWAISAGAMLAYSCRTIAIVKDASMGAAEPILQTGEKTSEKVHSAMRADFANRAAFFDRNPLIAEAMVDSDLFLVWREGKVKLLQKEEELLPTDKIITKKGKLLTLNAEELMEYHVADLMLPPTKLIPITVEEKKAGVWSFEKMLLSKASQFSVFSKAKVIAYKPDWKIEFFSFLATPLISSLLLLGLMIAVYVELHTGGFGVAAIFGIICLFLLILSSYAVVATPWLEVIILVVGIVLILLEIFVVPSFGFVGILGIIMAVFALGALLLPSWRDFHFDFDTNTLNAAGHFILERLVWLSGTFILGLIILAILAKWLSPKLQLFSPFVLRSSQAGYSAGMALEKMPAVGDVGEVLAPLRLAGKVLIKGKIYDAVSSGKFYEKGVKVKVIEIYGSKLVVEEIA